MEPKDSILFNFDTEYIFDAVTISMGKANIQFADWAEVPARFISV